ncbi:MAG TPA: hypothetical protein VL970_12855, partial [Candidatus Acidoferrales bacterium]|nr:hypothetical protein [Candidatus Acidoferrales bacterium]
LEAGATASYGTVVEPCNYTYKFPDPMVYFYQNRGFCMAEAYYQSLANPYQGLIVGEPLSAPFARPGSAAWNSPAEGSVLSGLASFDLSFFASDTNHPLTQVDLFVDGGFMETITNVPPGAGNVLSVSVGTNTASYTIAPGDSLGSAAVGLASSLNSLENKSGAQATAVGDRLVLRSQVVSTLGDQIPMQARSAIGSASELDSFASAPLPTFVDSSAFGYHAVQAANSPNPGDWLQLTITKTNGLQVTEAVTNVQTNATITSLLQDLMNQINGDPALQTADGVSASDLLYQGNGFYFFLVNGNSPGWPAAQIQTSFTGSPDLLPTPAGTYTLDDNFLDLEPRAHVYLSSGAAFLPVQFTLDTTRFADGFHQLTAVAYEGTSVHTQTRIERSVQFRNTPLTATLSAVGSSTNGDLLFTVAANASNITQIQLFSTGGAAAAATNMASALLTASATNLGAGLHPFYALAIDSNGHKYQTAPIWEQVPALKISIIGPPFALSWPSIAGREYNILAATNLAGAWAMAGSTVASSSEAQWPIAAPPGGSVFYQVSIAP